MIDKIRVITQMMEVACHLTRDIEIILFNLELNMLPANISTMITIKKMMKKKMKKINLNSMRQPIEIPSKTLSKVL